MEIKRIESGYQLGNLTVENLPPRQAQILLCCVHGLTEKAAALLLNCSAKNINAIKSTLMYKFDAHSTAELVGKAFIAKSIKILVLIAAINIALVPQHNSIRVAKIRVQPRALREWRIC